MEDNENLHVYVDGSQQSIAAAMSQAAQAICQPINVSPNETVPCLLIAAFHIAMLATGESAASLLPKMQICLEDSARAADKFFGGRRLDS